MTSGKDHGHGHRSRPKSTTDGYLQKGYPKHKVPPVGIWSLFIFLNWCPGSEWNRRHEDLESSIHSQRFVLTGVLMSQMLIFVTHKAIFRHESKLRDRRGLLCRSISQKRN